MLAVLTSVVTLTAWLRYAPEQVAFVPGVVFLRIVFVVGALVGTIDFRQSQPERDENRLGSARPQWRPEGRYNSVLMARACEA